MSTLAIRTLALATLFIFVLHSSSSFAATRSVPAQYAGIQAAIDASADGDTIRVAPGTYSGSLDFTGKTVSLESQSGAVVTKIVGTNGHVLNFDGNDRATRVSGFTIQNAPGTQAAVTISNASPTLVDNRFIGGATTFRAIVADTTSLLLERNLFTGWTEGGVVSISNYTAATLRNNVFFLNGGVALSLNAFAGSSIDIANNTFADNDSAVDMGGENLPGVLLRNNIFYGGTEAIVSTSHTEDPTLQNNLFFNYKDNYAGFQDPTAGNGNITANPRLGGLTALDFHPDAGSAAIDAGLNAAVSSGDTDFYGAQRVRVGSSGKATVDIGAVEYVGVQPSIMLSLSASSVAQGTPVTITWSTSNAISCKAGGAWSGALALSGTKVVTPPAGTLSYTITCGNASASRLQSASVSVYAQPTVAVKFSPTTVFIGQVASLSWSSTGATSCATSGDWPGAPGKAALSGSSAQSFPVSGTFLYTLTCSNPYGSASASAKLTVIAGPTLNFSATDIPANGSAVLSWTSFAGATSCTASGALSGAQPTSGSKSIGPLAAGFYTYTLSCTGAVGTASTSQTISAYTPNQFDYQPIGVTGTGSPATVYALSTPGTLPPGGGLDGHGYAYNVQAFPYPLIVLGQRFELGYYLQPTGDSNRTISLAGSPRLANLTLLATGVNGNQPNQPFVVTYSDGTTSTTTQSLSDWHHPQHYSGETTAAAATSRISPTGAVEPGAYALYAYRIPADPTKIPVSLKLPPNRNVVALALSATVAPRMAFNALSSDFNVRGLATVGHGPANVGLDGNGYAYESDLVPSGFTWSGQQFPIGPADQPNAVANATLPLSNARTESLTILAAAVNGNQPDQTFIVTYTDGTTSAFKQSVSDWHHPQNYAGESIARATAYRITPTGARQAGIWDVYGYTFQTDPGKGVATLTLPKNRNVVVLAVNSLNR